MATKQLDTLKICGVSLSTFRPHSFGLVITGLTEECDVSEEFKADYLHKILLSKKHREEFLGLIDTEGLVVCRNVRPRDKSTYRKVRGKSSFGRLSQAEYYHHDGCSCPTKPRVNEIRLPYQDVHRNVATAVAKFGMVVKAQIDSLPQSLRPDESIAEYRNAFGGEGTLPPVEQWDQIQGRVTRLVRRELDAEQAREYFRQVDRAAGAYDLPWEMGESRLMLNNHSDLSRTMQHRRAYQKPKMANEQNGSLVKRWTAEEYG